MKTLVIIPSYNEADNIVKLCRALLKLKVKLDVLVVDDNSPDGTADRLRKAFKTNRRVHLIVRTKKDGRGGAVMEGIQWGKKKKFDIIAEMDADFSHDPKQLPLLIDKSNDCDVVIGSRYLKGSQIINWPATRRVFSFFSNTFAQCLLNIPISDYTNGYRVYTKKALRYLKPKHIKFKNYIVLSEIAYLLHLNGLSFGEVPIIFKNRKRGTSNLSLKEISSAFFGIIELRFKRKKALEKL